MMMMIRAIAFLSLCIHLHHLLFCRYGEMVYKIHPEAVSVKAADYMRENRATQGLCVMSHRL